MENLTKVLQELLLKEKIDALLLRSCDRYFNEYVPKEQSFRAQITGFDGSVGDAIIMPHEAHLFVDGRYTLQARTQVPDYEIHVTELGRSIEQLWLDFLKHKLGPKSTVAVDPDIFDLDLFSKLETQGWPMVNAQKLLNAACPLKPNAKSARVWPIPEAICGMSVAEKLRDLAPSLTKNGIDAWFLTKLDDIAWATNLRSDYFVHQRAVPGLALITKDHIVLGLNDKVDAASIEKNNIIKTTKESQFFSYIKDNFGQINVVGARQADCSKSHERALKDAGISIKPVDNPLLVKKALKNEKELLHMRSAFRKADQVVYQTQEHIIDCFANQTPLTEGDVDRFVEEAFKKSGSDSLSFRTICASGKNGAVIHYGTPNHQDALSEGSLFLLDTGAYYEGGYATDLTRTFLAAQKTVTATSWQKEMFTLVLKSSIAGLAARFRRGTTGMQLDAVVRAPLWQAGLDFAHGTGHGVGINVHEFPPRIGPTSLSVLQESQVFSIEPGIYIEGLGGVRIENLVTVVADENPAFLRILPLTFCPFDERLIEQGMLTDFEKGFLEYYRKEWFNQAAWPNLPPLKTVTF